MFLLKRDHYLSCLFTELNVPTKIIIYGSKNELNENYSCILFNQQSYILYFDQNKKYINIAGAVAIAFYSVHCNIPVYMAVSFGKINLYCT